MSLFRILDESIAEAPPPFPDLEGLIARERRRWRARQAAAAAAGACAVLLAAVGIQVLVGTAGGSGPAPGAPTLSWLPPDAAQVPLDETPEARLVRLSALLARRMAAVVPGATVAPALADGPLFRLDTTISLAGYDRVEATVRVPTAAGTTELAVAVMRPLAPPYPPPTGGVEARIFGGCAGQWPTTTSTRDSCETLAAPDGATVWIARHVDEGEQVVTALFPDGGAVTVTGELGTPGPTAAQLTNVIADPGFVDGNAAAPYQPADVPSNIGGQPRTLPDDPQLGVTYPFDLFSHCGTDLASFAGHVWRSVEPDDGSYPGWFVSGTMELLDRATARFVIDQHLSPTAHEVIVYRWTDEQMPPCD